MMTKEYRIIIPARWASSRFPGKPIEKINGKPLIQHTYENTIKCFNASEVIIATDDERIAETAKGFGADVQMTGKHPSATDRLAQVAIKRGWENFDMVVNVQCDEPTMPPANIEQVAANLRKRPTLDAATLYLPITQTKDVEDPNVVKVVWELDGQALYFSRSPIPYGGKKNRHIGIYAYWVKTLKWFHHLDQCDMEKDEALEQMRILWYGGNIHVAKAVKDMGPSVDAPGDIAKVEEYLNKQMI
jgi:3-deoxy-manno-octulosonate cytidylyltransferase (CMP-KDO synthetase)